MVVNSSETKILIAMKHTFSSYSHVFFRLSVSLCLVCLLTLMTRCSPENVLSTVSPTTQNPYTVDIQMAQQVATRQFEIQFEDSNKTLSNSGRVGMPTTRVVRKAQIVKDDNEVLFHVINYDRGFVIVSADKRTVPVLAYSEVGSFDLDSAPNGVKDWISFAKDQVKKIKLSGKKSSKVIDKIWTRYLENGSFMSNARVASGCPPNEYFSRGPLIATHWNQGAGYNYYCPDRSMCACGKATVGCAAVAVGQIMSFWRFPNQGRHESFNWNTMLNDDQVSNSCTIFNEGDRLVARLLNDIGEWANSHYYNNPANCNTYTWSDNLDEAFQGAGYSNGGQLINFYDNLESLRGLLRSGYPFILVGTTCDTCLGDAHMWVCDGYESAMYYEEEDSGGKAPICNGYGYELFHVNWGYSGSYDGWFSAHNFTNQNGTYNKWMRAQAYMHP